MYIVEIIIRRLSVESEKVNIMSMHKVSFIHTRLVRFIDTLEFVPGNLYYMVNHDRNVSAIIFCSKRDSRSAKFIRIYVITGVWPGVDSDEFVIWADEPNNIIDKIDIYEIVPQIQIDQLNMIMHIRADIDLKMI